MRLCKHQDCAVCSNFEHRSIFEYILNKKYPDVYLCSHASYVAKNYNQEEFSLNIDNVHIGRGGCYTIDPYRGQLIYLSKENFRVECRLDECVVEETYVAKYIIGQHKRDN